jgi:5-formyltetrahydrofolate cyclo-ligase
MSLLEKKEIRKKILSIRDAIDENVKILKDYKIRNRLIQMPEFIYSNKILLYASFRSEVDTMDLLKYCLNTNKIVVFPKVNRIKDCLNLYKISQIDDLKVGYAGILEPDVSESQRVVVNELDLIIVPGVAFDENCNRLGYGKGFYDKLLKNFKKTTIGLAYEEQIIELLTVESHDVKINKIITDERVIVC